MKKLSFITILIIVITAVIFPALAEACLVSGPGWEIRGVADFNGDGSRDVLWSNPSTSDAVLWYMHGNTLVSEQKLEIATHSAWHIVGVGDFNGDARPDILLWNKETGEVQIRYLNGHEETGHDFVAMISGTWNIVGSGTSTGTGTPTSCLGIQLPERPLSGT